MAEPSEEPLQTHIVDDKSPRCIPFILDRFQAHLQAHPTRPFILGLNGVQGVGKTTFVRALATALHQAQLHPTAPPPPHPHPPPPLALSIDDFYLPHAAQQRLAAAHPANALVQARGAPGTHDAPLLRAALAALRARAPARLPRYDKAARAGRGDRVRPAEPAAWPAANARPGAPPVRLVLLEGWCVGFRAVGRAAVEAAWRAGGRTLARHRLEDLLFVDEQLKEYDAVTDMFDAFIHIDAEDTSYVYEWRLQQEQQLRRERGTGMTDEQVVKFVDAFYPAYELYSDGVRAGIFPDRKGCQLRLVVDKDRRVIDEFVI